MDNRTDEIQRAAWDFIQTPDYWFRRHYNLSPADPRYLEITKEEIILDFWCHVLYDRMLKLRNEGVEADDITLESLTIDDVFEEEFRKARAEAKAKKEEQQPAAEPPVIDFRG